MWICGLLYLSLSDWLRANINMAYMGCQAVIIIYPHLVVYRLQSLMNNLSLALIAQAIFGVRWCLFELNVIEIRLSNHSNPKIWVLAWE